MWMRTVIPRLSKLKKKLRRYALNLVEEKDVVQKKEEEEGKQKKEEKNIEKKSHVEEKEDKYIKIKILY